MYLHPALPRVHKPKSPTQTSRIKVGNYFTTNNSTYMKDFQQVQLPTVLQIKITTTIKAHRGEKEGTTEARVLVIVCLYSP